MKKLAMFAALSLTAGCSTGTEDKPVLTACFTNAGLMVYQGRAKEVQHIGAEYVSFIPLDNFPKGSVITTNASCSFWEVD